jgi:hypothetical protein
VGKFIGGLKLFRALRGQQRLKHRPSGESSPGQMMVEGEGLNNGVDATQVPLRWGFSVLT